MGHELNELLLTPSNPARTFIYLVQLIWPKNGADTSLNCRRDEGWGGGAGEGGSGGRSGGRGRRGREGGG